MLLIWWPVSIVRHDNQTEVNWGKCEGTEQFQSRAGETTEGKDRKIFT